MPPRYILVDPFATHTSGVTRYCELAAGRLADAGIATNTVSRHSTESIEAFRSRLSATVSRVAGPETVIEVPETLAASRELANHHRLHIRLHGSRDLGARLQGLQIDQETRRLEAVEIGRAWLVSAPSQAAVAAAQLSYQHCRPVSVLPNPLPNPKMFRELKDCDIDVLFLGRWQALKGTQYLETLVSVLPNLQFGIASDRTPGNLGGRCTVLKANTELARNSALLRSRVVAIPSLFETASMVGLEALAHRRPVVTWSHLGLAEYASAPLIRCADAFNTNSFAESIELALSSPPISSDCTSLNDLNLHFDRSIQLIVSGVRPPANGDLRHPASHNTTKVLNKMFDSETSPRRYILQRKARKLVRDPATFWRDSALNKALTNHGGSFFPGRPVIRKPAGLSASTANAFRKSSYPEHRLLGSISEQGLIKLKEVRDRQGEWSTGLIHHTKDCGQIARLVGELDQFSDFSAVRAENLSLIQYAEMREETVVSILARLDQVNKKRIAQIRNLICFDTPPVLLTSLRSCSPTSRVIALLTDGYDDANRIDPAIVDTLIVPTQFPVGATNEWRRIIRYESPLQIPSCIRRIVQETGPKTPDLLFPLINANDYDSSLLEFDTSKYQGIIELEKPVETGYRTYADLCEAVARNIKRMLVTESVFLRYYAQCESIQLGGSAATFLQLSSTDGVLFDVR